MRKHYLTSHLTATDISLLNLYKKWMESKVYFTWTCVLFYKFSQLLTTAKNNQIYQLYKKSLTYPLPWPNHLYKCFFRINFKFVSFGNFFYGYQIIITTFLYYFLTTMHQHDNYILVHLTVFFGVKSCSFIYICICAIYMDIKKLSWKLSYRYNLSSNYTYREFSSKSKY